MTGPSHVLSPEGEWLHFDAWDPAGVEAVKAVLDANIRSIPATHGGYNPSTQEVAPAVRQHPGARPDLQGGPAMVNDSSSVHVEAETAP